MKFSVIIRCKNESRWIGYAVQSVLDFLFEPEILIVDNNSTDNSLEIVKNFKHDSNLLINNRYSDLKILNLDNYSPGKSINLGVQNASNENILLLSAHCEIKALDLESIKLQLSQNSCLFGKQIPIYFGKKITPRYIWSHFLDEKLINMFSNLENRYFFHNAFSFFKKETLIEFPFDEELTGKEDRYWAQNFINNQNEIIYDPNNTVNHHYTINGNTWKGLS